MQYQHAMADVTMSFQSLSKEVIAIAKDFNESGYREEAQILERLQQAEKEKLELTVQWQVLFQQESEREEDVDDNADFGASESKKEQLKKKYDVT